MLGISTEGSRSAIASLSLQNASTFVTAMSRILFFSLVERRRPRLRFPFL